MAKKGMERAVLTDLTDICRLKQDNLAHVSVYCNQQKDDT